MQQNIMNKLFSRYLNRGQYWKIRLESLSNIQPKRLKIKENYSAFIIISYLAENTLLNVKIVTFTKHPTRPKCKWVEQTEQKCTVARQCIPNYSAVIEGFDPEPCEIDSISTKMF